MSATNSATARRREAPWYGAANAARTSLRSGGRDSEVAARTNVGVRAHTRSRRTGRSTSRIRAGPGVPSGRCTAVFVNTTPRSWSRCRAAQPSEIGPPQSWATVTVGPDTPRASVSPDRSDTRWASVRGPSSRSEYPIPSWSGATTRHRGGAEANSPRHRYDHVGLPCTQSTVSSGSGTQVSSTCQVCLRPSSSSTATRRDQEGSSPGRSCGGRRAPPVTSRSRHTKR